jgi:hypothetical protein
MVAAQRHYTILGYMYSGGRIDRIMVHMGFHARAGGPSSRPIVSPLRLLIENMSRQDQPWNLPE